MTEAPRIARPTHTAPAARAGLMALLALAALLASATVARAQFNTPTIDGAISAGEYGDHVENMNRKTSGGQTWYVTWDNTNLYVAVTNANISEGAVLYLDIDPLTAPRSGTNFRGTLTGFNYDGASYSTLPFRADFVAYFKNGYREYRRKDNANGWSSQTTFFGSYADSGTGNVRELAIPWNDITAGAGRPSQLDGSKFSFFGYVVSATGFIFGQVPPSNPGGFTGPGTTADRFYRVLDSDNGESTEPFSSEYGNCFEPPANMAAWWTGNAYRDDIQGANHLTLRNGLAFASGKVRSAFSLDGTDDYAEAPDSASLSVTGSVSVDAWIRADALAQGNNTVVSKYDEGTGEKSYWLYVDGNGVLWFFVGGPNGDRLVRSQNAVINTGVFKHVAATFDGASNTATLYVDGASVPLTVSGGTPDGVKDSTAPLRIGASSDSSVTPLAPVAHFNGLIDEVEIFGRALSASEVNAIFRADNVGKCAVDLAVTEPIPAPASIMIGEQITYSFLITNNGYTTAPSSTFTVTLPAGLNYVSSSGPLGCSESSGVVTCQLGLNLPGAVFNVQVTAEASAGGVFGVLGRATTATPDLRPGNDRLTLNTTSVTMRSLTLSHAGRTGGCDGASQNATGTILFNRPAPRAGTITLGSSSPAAVVPASVSFSAGDTQATFTVTPQLVSASTPVNITATLDNGAATLSAPFTVKPILIQSFTLDASSVTAGTNVTGTVTLTCAPASDISVALFSNRPATAPVPQSLQVPAGSPSNTFNIQTTSTGVPTTATIAATLNGKTLTRKLTVNPAQF